jgi:UDP-N-acetylmuramate: L-alanyl-gamma-D-glutamyl-meso-diaminopimelate ligase
MADIPLVEDNPRRRPPPVDWSKVTAVHLMGICGSAMGALAQMLVKAGYQVRGSDTAAYPPMSTTLEALGVVVMEGYRAENLAWAPDAVVVGNVIRPSYEEAVELRRRGIPGCSLPEAIAGLFIQDRQSLVVTGTHGKTTTTSLTAWILEVAGLSPGFMVGGVTGNFGSNHRLPSGRVFVTEGDEYDTAYFDKGPKFLHYRPTIASVNNLELDHVDIYPNLEAIEAAFARFAALVPASGTLVVPESDPRALAAAGASAARIWRFGDGPSAQIRVTDVRVEPTGTGFVLHLPDAAPVATRLPAFGAHNLANAMTAAGLAYAAGASPTAIAHAMPEFVLPGKRQELKGVVREVPVVDDFAHHPTAIRETLKSLRTRFPGRRLLVLFEIESNTSRRRVFQEAFREALSLADEVLFCRPLEKADSLPPEERLDLPRLIADLTAQGTPAELIPEIDELAETAARRAEPGRTVIVGMSGRHFHGVHAKVLAALGRA